MPEASDGAKNVGPVGWYGFVWGVTRRIRMLRASVQRTLAPLSSVDISTMLSLQTSSGSHSRGFLDPAGCDDCIKRSRPPDEDEHSEQRKKLALMPPPRTGLQLGSPAPASAFALHRERSFEFFPNPTAARPATSNNSSGSRSFSLEDFRTASEITFGFGGAHTANPHNGADVYEEAATADLNLQVGTHAMSWSLSPLVPLAEPVQPQPAPDPDSNVFKPEPMLHLNGQAMQHLSILKEMRAKVVHALHHRISRRVSAGRLTEQAADALQKISSSRLVKPVSIALQRYCQAKRYFAESQSCLSHIALADGSGALGLFTKDVDAITESLANSIAKAAVQGEAALAQQQQQQQQQGEAALAQQQQQGEAALAQQQQQQQQQQGEPNQHGESAGNAAAATSSGAVSGRLLEEPAGPGAASAVSQLNLGLPLPLPLACRRPPTQAPHRLSFCGPKSGPGNHNVAAAAVDAELFGFQSLPSTPRSSNAGESGEPFKASSRLTPSPQPMRAPEPSGQGVVLLEMTAGVLLEQSTDSAPVILSRQSCSSSGLWQQQQQQQVQPEKLGSGALGLPAPASSVVSCVSPAHLSLSSAESPHARDTGKQASSGERDADQGRNPQQHAWDHESRVPAAPGSVPAELVASSSGIIVQAVCLAAAPLPEATSHAGSHAPGAGAVQATSRSCAADAGAAAFSSEPKSALADAMASTFSEGSESVDWFVVVQDVYGVDPEELLLQQQGLEEDQEEQVEQKQIWTNIRAPTRH